MSSTGIFNTNEVRDWTKPQLENTKTITFPSPFVAPPRLPVGLNYLDYGKDKNLRVKAEVDKITQQGFVAKLNGWGDSVVYCAGLDYLALAPGQLEYDCGEYTTTSDHPWNRPQEKTSARIKFSHPFVTPPKVVVFLNSLDIDQSKNYRVKTYVSNVDTTGFTIHIDSWFDSILYSAKAGWVAYPEDRKDVCSGSVNITEVRPWDKPQHQNNQAVKFPENVNFCKAPQVFMALNSIDIDRKSNIRAKCYASNVTTRGLTWHADSWGDSVLYSAGMSYICIP
ncbi:hypothetical protein FRB90_011979 [Tulasnella sp. 427]|nr:hypothetical protein FRB90_011979 [Tulasnella sp. 427]